MLKHNLHFIIYLSPLHFRFKRYRNFFKFRHYKKPRMCYTPVVEIKKPQGSLEVNACGFSGFIGVNLLLTTIKPDRHLPPD